MRYLCLLLLPVMTSCWMLRAYKVRHMRLTDHNKIASVLIATAPGPFQFVHGQQDGFSSRLAQQLDTALAGTGTGAFLVIRNDSILYERYFNGCSETTLFPSQSMAKSFVGTLLSIALSDGNIHSLSDPVSLYLPELAARDPRFRNITLQHLLDMRSGLAYTEGTYTLKDDGVRLGFRPNLAKHILKIRIAGPPGAFKYQSINTMLLGLVIQRTTGRPLQDYLEEKLWKPLGMEHAATWNVDSRKRRQVIVSSAINATARDFARLGRLYAEGGWWQHRQLLDSAWVYRVASIDSMAMYGGYNNQWWSRKQKQGFGDSLQAAAFAASTPYADKPRLVSGQYKVAYFVEAFNASGFLNQAIYVQPKKKLVIVRLGLRWQHPVDFNQFLYQLGASIPGG